MGNSFQVEVCERYLGTDKQVRYWCQDESRLGLHFLNWSYDNAQRSKASWSC